MRKTEMNMAVGMRVYFLALHYKQLILILFYLTFSTTTQWFDFGGWFLAALWLKTQNSFQYNKQYITYMCDDMETTLLLKNMNS